jgi:hypothetical protein
MTRSRVARTAVALLFGLAVFPGGGADAATLGDKGWWWFGNAGSGTRLTPPGVPGVAVPEPVPETPPPPDVPENGLLVERAATPDGQQTTAIGAVRFEMMSGESSPVLELKAASTTGTPALLACLAGSAWTGSHGGRWDYKPLVACDPASEGASVAGVAGAENVWTFNLTGLVVGADEEDGGGTVDVVIVPARDAAAAAQPPFRIVFEAVTQESLKTTLGAGGAGGFELSDDFASALEAGGLDSTTFDTFSAPTDSLALAEPDLPATDQGLDATAPAVAAQTENAVIRPPAPDDGAATAAAIFVILVAAAAAYYGSQQGTPRVQGLIPLRAKKALPAEDVVRVGGLGRFARPRMSPPIRLG